MRDKAFNFAKNPNYDGYQRGLASMVYKFFDNKSKGSGINNEIKQNKQLVEELADELHKLIVKKIKKKEKYIDHSKTIFGVLI